MARGLYGERERVLAPVVAGFMAVVTYVHQAKAQNLSHFISNLYGGQGIILANTPGPEEFNHAHHFTLKSIDAGNSLENSIRL